MHMCCLTPQPQHKLKAGVFAPPGLNVAFNRKNSLVLKICLKWVFFFHKMPILTFKLRRGLIILFFISWYLMPGAPDLEK